jgi:hypothetical protein
LNTAIVLLLINNKVHDDGLIKRAFTFLGIDGFMLNGDYDDFSQPWFATVGQDLLVVSIFAGWDPITEFVKVFFCVFSVRCCDRGCTTNMKKTKSVMQEDYEKLYTGDELPFDERFATIVAIIWVIMMFSTAIPFMYLGGIFLCVSLYWSDKILLLRLFRTPP